MITDPRPRWRGPVRKEEASCCTLRRDELGRLPVGFCSPTCERMTPTQQRRAARRRVAR